MAEDEPMAESIAVCIRVRPLNARERKRKDAHVLRSVPMANAISLTDASGQPLPGKHNVFRYDHIYAEDSSTQHIYDHVAKRIVRSAMGGINGTIFAYGQTSSGKTFTMQGADSAAASSSGAASDPSDNESCSPKAGAGPPGAPLGILQLAVEDIFSYIENCADRDFLLRVSYVEIYNEIIRDLLAAGDDSQNLKLREDPRKGVYVESKEEIITTYDDILHLLQVGNARRTVGHTAMNDRSSRSHSLFRIVIESKQKQVEDARRKSEDDVTGAVLVACLSLVDLAGSESVRNTAAEGLRQREAGNINKSLLTLSRVIHKLAAQGGATHNSQANSNAAVVPFRDSKLTRLLQNSLDGNTRTLMICCVTPSERYLEETKSTLQFAARAKDIQTSVHVNEVLDDQAQLKRLKREVHELKRLVDQDALNAIKAEKEALMHERSHNKAELVRLMGLMLSSATVGEHHHGAEHESDDTSENAERPRRTKRVRETWGPGDFAENLRSSKSRGRLLSPNPKPRKRVSAGDSDGQRDLEMSKLSLEATTTKDPEDSDKDALDCSITTGSGTCKCGAKSTIDSLTQQVEEAFQTVEDMKSLNSAEVSELNEVICQLQERERELLVKVESMESKATDTETLRWKDEQRDMMVAELDTLQQRAEEAEHNFEMMATKVGKLEQALEVFENAQKAHEDKRAWLCEKASNDAAYLEHCKLNEERMLKIIADLEAQLAQGINKMDSAVTTCDPEMINQLEEQMQLLQNEYEAKLLSAEESMVLLEAKLQALELDKQQLVAQLAGFQDQPVTGDHDSSESNSAQMKSLEERVEQLTQDYERVLKERDNLFEELSALEALLMEESKEKSELYKQLHDSQSAIASVTDQMTMLDQEVQELNERSAQLEQDASNASAHVGELEATNTALREQIEHLQTIGENSGNRSSSMEEQSDLESETRKKLELDVKSYEEALMLHRNELKENSETINGLAEKLSAMEQAANEAAQERHTSEQEIKRLSIQLQHSNEEKEELRFQMKQRYASNDAQAMLYQVETLQQELKETKNSFAAQAERWESEAATNQRSWEEKESSQHETIQELQQQIRVAHEQLAAQENDWSETARSAEDQFALLNSTICSLQEQIEQLENNSKEAQEQEKLTVSELEEVKCSYADVLQEKAELEKELSASELRWQTKEQELGNKIGQEIEALRSQAREAQQSLEEYESYAEGEIHRLRTIVEDKDNELRSLQQKVESTETLLQQQQEQCGHIEHEMATLQEEYSAACAEHQRLVKQAEGLEAAATDINALRQQLQESTAQCESAESKQAELSEQVLNMQETIEKREGEIFQQRNDLEELSESLKSSQMEATHYHNQLAEVEAANESLTKLTETQQLRLEKLEKVKMTTETLNVFRKLKSDREELTETVQQLKAELLAAKKTTVVSNDRSQRQQEELVAHKDEHIKQLKDQVQELSQNLQAETERKEAFRAEYERTVCDMTDKSEEELQQMQSLLRDKGQELEALETRLATLQTQYEELTQHKSSRVAYLEKENLDLLVENRTLQKHLEAKGGSTSSSISATSATTVSSEAAITGRSSMLLDESVAGSPSPSGPKQHGFLVSSEVTSTAALDADNAANPACKQQ